jgi:hypothetical protein
VYLTLLVFERLRISYAKKPFLKLNCKFNLRPAMAQTFYACCKHEQEGFTCHKEADFYTCPQGKKVEYKKIKFKFPFD